MKKVKLLAVVFFVAAANVAMAQSKTVIKINVLSPFVRTANIALERAITENSSIQLGFYYTGAKINNGDSDIKLSGFSLTPEYKFYLSETAAPNGFYVAPFLRYISNTLSIENSTDEATITRFGGGVVAGRQWVFKERVTFDLFIGPKYLSRDLKVKSGTDTGQYNVNFFNNFGVRGGITLGVAF